MFAAASTYAYHHSCVAVANADRLTTVGRALMRKMITLVGFITLAVLGAAQEPLIDRLSPSSGSLAGGTRWEAHRINARINKA